MPTTTRERPVANPKISIYLPEAANEVLRGIATKRGLTATATIRLALGWLQVIEDAQSRGEYVGTTHARENLNTVIVTPL